MTDLREAPRVARQRRLRHRHTIVLVVVGVLLFGSFGYAGAYFQGWVGQQGSAAAPDRCRPLVRPAPAHSTITVNVFNSTDKVGLARIVAKGLRARSFRVIAVANDPQGAVLNGPGEVRYGAIGAAAAQVVAGQVKGVRMAPDARTDTSVDLVVGLGFKTLVPAPPQPPPPPGRVTLNVYNTTYHTGLAAAVARDMRSRGFRIGQVSNDPLQRMIAGTAEIRHGEDGMAAARVVASHLPGATLVTDRRAGTSVDLVIGNAFTALLPAADVPHPPPPPRTPAPTVTLKPDGC